MISQLSTSSSGLRVSAERTIVFDTDSSTIDHLDSLILEDGNRIVAWTATRPDGSVDVLAQRFNAEWQALAYPFLLNSTEDGAQSDAELTLLANGNIAATWVSEVQDGDGTAVVGQLLRPDGTKIGSEWQSKLPTNYRIG